MKTCIAVCLALCALIVTVYSTACGDAVDAVTACNSSTSCAAGLELACEHHKCTCSPIPTPCLGGSGGVPTECAGLMCTEHKETMHCIDGYCKCADLH